MVKIITDSSTLLTRAEAAEMGCDVAMLCVSVNGKTYRELEEIKTGEFVEIIRQGHVPASSQPALGEVLDLYSKYPEDEVLNVTIADGLSGTYQTALSAAGMAENPGRVTVFNSRTLCFPHRSLVRLAVGLAKKGESVRAIAAELEKLAATAKSYLIPRDFDYLRRGGRLSPLMAHIGKLIRIAPVMTQTEDGKHLTRLSIQRSFKHAVHVIAEDLKRLGVDPAWQIGISHAMAEDSLRTAEGIIRAAFPGTDVLTFLLSPAFTVQGGPGCIAIQAVRKHGQG